MIGKLPGRTRPIIYHPGVADNFNGWAAACGYKPTQLRCVGELAIRNRHHRATVLDHGAGPRPDVWTLRFGKAAVIYTIEPHAIVIRGYSWDIDGDPLDDSGGGGYYHDNSWHMNLAFLGNSR